MFYFVYTIIQSCKIYEFCQYFNIIGVSKWLYFNVAIFGSHDNDQLPPNKHLTIGNQTRKRNAAKLPNNFVTPQNKSFRMT